MSSDKTELDQLTAYNTLPALREDIGGTGATGNQIINRPEFAQLGHSGLSSTTPRDAAYEIIARQRKFLQDSRDALTKQDKATPGNEGPTAAPLRGQTFNGPNGAAADALGLR